jgi:hypothetical protein
MLPIACRSQVKPVFSLQFTSKDTSSLFFTIAFNVPLSQFPSTLYNFFFHHGAVVTYGLTAHCIKHQMGLPFKVGPQYVQQPMVHGTFVRMLRAAVRPSLQKYSSKYLELRMIFVQLTRL